jgi:hypothetical protein
MPPPLMTQPPDQPEPNLLEYRSRAMNGPPRVGLRQWVQASVVLGGLSWMSGILLCGGATSRLAMLPVGFAAGGLVCGVVSIVQPLPRESLGDALIGLFMSFTVLAIWLLALAVF